MKKFIDTTLAIFSPLAATPTGWAIYAGVTKQPAFPMWQPVAIVGALAIIAVDIAAATLVTDISTFNQTLKNKTEQALSMSTRRAWAILLTAIVAEIILGLVIVVFESLLAYGVLVFPIMTGAGVFAFAVRTDLQERESKRDQMRVKPKRTAKHSEESPKPTAKSPKGWPRKCDYCDEVLDKPQSKGGHMKKHHPDKTLRKAYQFTPIEKVTRSADD